MASEWQTSAREFQMESPASVNDQRPMASSVPETRFPEHAELNEIYEIK